MSGTCALEITRTCPRVILAQVEERHRVGVRVDDRGGQTLPTTSQKGQSASSALCMTDRWVVGD
jgi:hypothetical protein